MSQDKGKKKNGDPVAEAPEPIAPLLFDRDELALDELDFEGLDEMEAQAIFEKMLEYFETSALGKDNSIAAAGDAMNDIAGFSGELKQAHELVLQAHATDDPQQQIQLAHEALQICPDCADAWLLMADNAESAEEALELFERAVEAGQRVIGDNFERFKGRLWDYVPARSYLRALEGKASVHGLLRQHQMAIAAHREILDLNPVDEQGVRWLLLERLLLVRAHDDARALIDRYADESFALWPYSQLLLAFVEARPETELLFLLERAYAANPNLIAYLLDEKPVPEVIPEYFSIGEESEALCVLSSLLPAWRTTPGLPAWFRKAVAKQGWSPTTDRHDSRQRSQALKSQAMAAPQDVDAVWQVDYLRIKADDESFWSIVVVDPHERSVRHEELLYQKPRPADVYLCILNAMVGSEESVAAARPGKIRFAKKTLAKSLQKRLEQLSAKCDVGEIEELNAIRNFVLNMSQGNVKPEANPLDAEEVAGMVWLVGGIQMRTPIEEEGDRFRPWVLLAIDRETGLVLQVEVTAEIPGPDRFCDLVRRSVFYSPFGKAIKPEVIHVRSHDERATLCEPLREWGIRCEISDEFSNFDETVESLQSQIGAGAVPSLAEVAGITTGRLTFFYEAAAEFYTVAPWVHTRADAVFRIRSSALEFPIYAVVMGQLGAIFGLAVYTNLDDVRKKFSEGLTNVAETLASMSGRSWSLMFVEQDGIAAADADAIDINGWPIAAPEAFPLVVRLEGAQMSTPSHRDDVDLISHCLTILAKAEYPILSPQQFMVRGVSEAPDDDSLAQAVVEPISL